MKKTIFAALAAILAGCATKTRSVETDGVFAEAGAGFLAVGSVDVMASPQGEESIIAKFERDASVFNSAAKKAMVKLQFTGTNSVKSAPAIMRDICAAFACATNTVEVR